MRLTRALGRFWRARWQLAEGRAWLERAVAIYRTDDGLRAELLGLLGAVLHEIGDLVATAQVLTEALRAAEIAADPVLDARLRVAFADVRVMVGEITEADGLAECETAAARLEAAHDNYGLSDALVVVGKVGFWLRVASHRETLERAAGLPAIAEIARRNCWRLNGSP